MSRKLPKPEPSARSPQPVGEAAPGHYARPLRPLRPVRRKEPHSHRSVAEIIHEGEEEEFIHKHRVALVAAGVVVIGLAIYFFPKPRPIVAERRVDQMTMVQPIPPPPKPHVAPPPKPKEPPPPETMKRAMEVQDRPEEARPKSDNPPPSALATGIHGDGPGIGLASSGNGIGGGTAIGGSSGGGNQWGQDAGQVQSKITAALHANASTKTAAFGPLEVRIWPDGTGRIKRVKLAHSTGNAALDDVIENQVLSDLQLAAPPPVDMPLPIVLRISAWR